MNLATLLGPNVDPKFTRAVEYTLGYQAYPIFNAEYQHSEGFIAGYSAAYHDEMDAREEREAERLRFPRSAEIDRKHGF